jgi:hypothetical protein
MPNLVLFGIWAVLLLIGAYFTYVLLKKYRATNESCKSGDCKEKQAEPVCNGDVCTRPSEVIEPLETTSPIQDTDEELLQDS